MHSSKNHSRGLTFIELVVAIAVLAILLVIGMPSIHESIKNNRVAGQNNELVALISLAKSEAIRRNTEVTLELTETANGWEGVVFDPDGDENIQECNPGVLRCASNADVALNQSRTLVFDNRGYLTPFAGAEITLTHKQCSGSRQHRIINVLGTGQIQSGESICPS